MGLMLEYGEPGVEDYLREQEEIAAERKATMKKNCEHGDAVMWNEYNGVVQCHRCGVIFVPRSRFGYWWRALVRKGQ